LSVYGYLHLKGSLFVAGLLLIFTLLIPGAFTAAPIDRCIDGRAGVQAHAALDADLLVNDVRFFLLTADGLNRADPGTSTAA
jgi:hypothetical protein